jgi:hypothetical protein
MQRLKWRAMVSVLCAAYGMGRGGYIIIMKILNWRGDQENNEMVKYLMVWETVKQRGQIKKTARQLFCLLPSK